jgi:hypothetical protein
MPGPKPKPEPTKRNSDNRCRCRCNDGRWNLRWNSNVHDKNFWFRISCVPESPIECLVKLLSEDASCT